MKKWGAAFFSDSFGADALAMGRPIDEARPEKIESSYWFGDLGAGPLCE